MLVRRKKLFLDNFYLDNIWNNANRFSFDSFVCYTSSLERGNFQRRLNWTYRYKNIGKITTNQPIRCSNSSTKFNLSC